MASCVFEKVDYYQFATFGRVKTLAFGMQRSFLKQF